MNVAVSFLRSFKRFHACNRFNAAHAGSYTAFGSYFEQADIACALNVNTAAKLNREVLLFNN